MRSRNGSLTCEKAVGIAPSMEAADKDSMTLASNRSINQAVGRIQRMSNPTLSSRHHHNSTSNMKREEKTASKPTSVQGYCCGKAGHMTNVCRFRGYK